VNEHKGCGPLRPDHINAELRNDLGARPLPGSDGEHRLQAHFIATRCSTISIPRCRFSSRDKR
jgi:hypothetical protein